MNRSGPLMNVHATILLAIRSTSVLYCVAMTNTPGAAGIVPYKNPNVLRSVVSDILAPAFMMFTVWRFTSGRTSLNETKNLLTNFPFWRDQTYNFTKIRTPGVKNPGPWSSRALPSIRSPNKNNAVAENEFPNTLKTPAMVEGIRHSWLSHKNNVSPTWYNRWKTIGKCYTSDDS